MPCLRGIEVSLTTKPENEKIPEYPHPEGTSARILSTLQNPTRFALNYKISSSPPAPCKYLFFRLYTNGRPIAAWGIDPVVRPKGQVVQSLWAPCTFYDEVGFEGRNFVFLPGQDTKSVAEDGGLIEVQVFRAKERRAREPRLEEFRSQENYGIATPRIGLLDQPRDACFYDWHLLDAKDSPFATFRLHYRSWKSLKQLNLIPATELEILCAASPKALRAIAKADAQAGGLDRMLKERSPQPEIPDEAVFHDHEKEPSETEARKVDTGFNFLKHPPELFPAVPSTFRVPQPSKTLRDTRRDEHQQRPLPQLPMEEPSSVSRRFSTASTVSMAESITASLLHYVDDEPLSPSEIEFSVAQLVRLPLSESPSNVNTKQEFTPEESSISDYEASPRSPCDSVLQAKLSPRRYLPTTGSGLERGIALFSSPKQPSFSGGPKYRESLPSDICSHCGFSPLKRRGVSESDTMSRSPLAGRAGTGSRHARRQSSPQASEEAGKSLFAGLRKMKLVSPSKSPGTTSGRDTRDRGSIVRRAMSSWI